MLITSLDVVRYLIMSAVPHGDYMLEDEKLEQIFSFNIIYKMKY